MWLYIIIFVDQDVKIPVPQNGVWEDEIFLKDWFSELSIFSIFYKILGTDCKNLFHGKKLPNNTLDLFAASDEDLSLQLDDCKDYFKKRQLVRGVRNFITTKELETPLAFSIQTHNNAVMFERLLSAIYRSHNTYCIHIDLKVKHNFYRVVKKLASCYNRHYKTRNIFITKKRVAVYWAHWSMVQADINCMTDLVRKSSSWKYYLNLAGTEYPLMDNRDIVEKVVGSANELVGSVPTPGKEQFRHSYVHYLDLGDMAYTGPKPTDVLKSEAPYGLYIFKGSKNIAITKTFVKKILFSQISKDLQVWFVDTWAPDEHFIPTLVRTSSGSQIHQDLDLNKYKAPPGLIAPELAIRFTVFEEAAPSNWSCGGIWQRWLCIFGTINLPELVRNRQKHIIANKFDLNIDKLVIQCLEEKIVNSSRAGMEISK